MIFVMLILSKTGVLGHPGAGGCVHPTWRCLSWDSPPVPDPAVPGCAPFCRPDLEPLFSSGPWSFREGRVYETKMERGGCFPGGGAPWLLDLEVNRKRFLSHNLMYFLVTFHVQFFFSPFNCLLCTCTSFLLHLKSDS